MCLSDFKTMLVSALCGIKSTKYVVVILVHFAHLLYNFFPLKFSCRLSRQICWILVFNWLFLLDIILDCFMYFFHAILAMSSSVSIYQEIISSFYWCSEDRQIAISQIIWPVGQASDHCTMQVSLEGSSTKLIDLYRINMCQYLNYSTASLKIKENKNPLEFNCHYFLPILINVCVSIIKLWRQRTVKNNP